MHRLHLRRSVNPITLWQGSDGVVRLLRTMSDLPLRVPVVRLRHRVARREHLVRLTRTSDAQYRAQMHEEWSLR